MVHVFCREQHATLNGSLCSDCSTLHDYAFARLEHCPFGEQKTTCRVCPIHCYRSTEREAMRDVMRFAGPKMLWRHPWLAIRHLWVERQGPPARKRQKNKPGLSASS